MAGCQLPLGVTAAAKHFPKAALNFCLNMNKHSTFLTLYLQ